MHIVFHSAIIYLVIILLVICVSPNFFFFWGAKMALLYEEKYHVCE